MRCKCREVVTVIGVLSVNSSADVDRLSVAAPAPSCPVSRGSLPDLITANIHAPLISPLDVTEPLTHAPSLPTYDMAVAASNRRTQLQQPAAVMTSEPVVLTDCHARAHLLSGGNTLVMLPQVRLTC